jgi:hypothetical protein
MRTAALAAVLVIACGGPATPAGDDRPLPEGNAYVRGLVDKQRHREELLDHYTYDLLAVREDLDDEGRVEERHTRRYEVFFVLGRPVRRLVEEDGRPLGREKQEKEDREARELADAVRSGRAVSERAGLRLSAILDRYVFRSLGREDVAGRPAVVLEFSPRSGETKTGDDRLLRRVHGRLWVDEAEEEIVRAEVQNLAPLKFGWGLGASVSSLSTRIEFRKVDDAVWLPAEEETIASGHMLLFRKFRRRFRRTYGGYRRFSVDSQESSPTPCPSPSPSPAPF